MTKQEIEDKYADFCSEVFGLPVDQLKARIVALQVGLKESEEHKEQNEELKAARAAVRELNSPYVDVKKAVKAKTQYILQLIEERGT